MTDASTTVTELKRLVATGNEITLVDGSTVRIRFNARVLAMVEDQYGSLDGFMQELNAMTGGKFYHHIAWVLQTVLRRPEDQIWDLIDTKRVPEYFKAIAAALLEAMPAPDENAAGNGTAAPGESLGAAISTLPSSTGTSLPTPSGT